MVITESDICLPEGTRLNRTKSNSQVLPQEIIKHVPNPSKRYLMVGNKGVSSNRQVIVQARLATKDGPGDRAETFNHDPVKATGHERLWVDEAQQHCGFRRREALRR